MSSPDLTTPDANSLGNGAGQSEAHLETRHGTHQVSAEVAAQVRALRSVGEPPVMAVEAEHTVRRHSNVLIWTIAGVVVLALAAWGTIQLLGGWSYLTGGTYALAAGGERVYLDDLKLQYQDIAKGNVDVLIIEKGELESAHNLDVVCRVRSSGRGDSPVSQIRWLVDEGAHVEGPLLGQHPDNEAFMDAMTLAGWSCPSVAPTLRTLPWLVTGHFNSVTLDPKDLRSPSKNPTSLLRGEKLVELDASGIDEQIRSHEITVEGSKAKLVQAENDKKITETQNETDIETAGREVKIATLDLKKYQQGDYELKMRDLAGRTKLAESDAMLAEERFGFVKRMVVKRFMSQVQAESDETRLRKALIELDRLRLEQRITGSFEFERNLTDWENKLNQAKQKLKTAEIQAASKMAQAEAAYQNAQATLGNDLAKLRDLREDRRNCTMYAPGTGTIVYFTQESDRMRGGGQQRLIAANEPVKQDQKLMRIPNLQDMQVKIKVHEAQAPRLRSSRSGGALGQPAKIKLPSLPEALRGTVKSVTPVASQADFFGGDVRVHPTVVKIENNKNYELKPGMSADVTIFVDECPNVIRIPVHAVLEAKGEKFCYVKEGSEIKKRVLTLGAGNNNFFEVKDGLTEGEIVVQNPRPVADRLRHSDDTAGEDNNDAFKKNGGSSPGAAIGTPSGTAPRGTGPRGTGPRGPRDGQPQPGPGAAGPGGGGFGGGGFQMTEEQRAQREKEMAEFKDSLKKAKTPAEKKALFDKRIADMGRRFAGFIPDEEQRNQATTRMKQRLKDDLAKDGIVIPD